MTTVNVLNMNGDVVGEVELNEDIFDIEINEHAVYEVVKSQLANKRQGTQSVKTRAEVRGGGRKPWKQKGTGRARHGSSRSPIWVGGGVTFAPKPRSYGYKVPKKVRRLALKSALTSKVNNKELIVVDSLDFEEAKTKKMVNFLNKINVEKALIVLDSNDKNVIRSANNIKGVETSQVNTINVYDILKYDYFVITKEALKRLEEVYA